MKTDDQLENGFPVSKLTLMKITRLKRNILHILKRRESLSSPLDDEEEEEEEEKDEHRWRFEWEWEEDWSNAKEVERRFEMNFDWVHRCSPNTLLHSLCESNQQSMHRGKSFSDGLTR